ncbi:MAG: ROK family transcriptional regulator [Pyrinomonadaceae bacterium]|nr:ROK family transcriptional regulator [Pyrinomonadaceae bacterium]MBP6211472.1 ROK family transcriptional regulator [Pyrinomonadaceae bacterium]
MKKIYLSKARNQIARHNTIRDINRQIVLNYVRVRSPISRAEIARETSLQRSTVSAIVDDLQASGLIEEIGTGDSTGGRKPTLLQLKTGTPVAIGVDITPRETTIVLADLGGNLLQKETLPTSPDLEYMNEQILTRVTALAKANEAYDLEIGISIPGIADQVTGNVLYVPYFQWVNWDIGRQITDATSLPVTIDNDANAVALAELWFGEEEIKKTRNFIMVMISEGIGTGIVIDGEVYRGENGAAGEFGHMYVGQDAPVTCSCGRQDCWEAHASEKAVIGRYLMKGNESRSGMVDMDHLVRLAANGEEQAIGILKETANYIGIGISNLLIGFSPQAVVVSGGIVKAWDMIKADIEDYGRRSIRQELSSALILPSTLGDTPTILGSISLVLARKFASAS